METLVLTRLSSSARDARPAPRRSLLARIGQVLCELRCGHDMIRGVDGRRLYLVCRHCFHESPGWEISGSGPRVRFR